MSLPRYPDYKHSGVDWLGEVPSHWKIERFKNVIDLRKITVGDTKGDYTLLSLTLQGVIARDMVNPKGKFPAEFDTYQVVEKEDLVFCLFDVEETPRAVGVSPCTGMVTGAYTVGRAKAGISAQYLYNFYLSRDQYKAFKMYYTGLRNVIRSETFNAIPCPIPPIDEQIGIANFLEIETAKIDILVAEQEKLIELLKEKRQAVISNAVTKGLNPKVEMKDSEVEWLGRVPKHWDVVPLKYFVSMKSGEQITSEQIREEGAFPVYGGNGLRGYFEKYTHDGEYPLIGRQGALCGNINYANGKFWASEHAVVVTPQKMANIFYLGELLRSMNLGQYSTSAAQPGLSVEAISNLRIPAPIIEEQNKIADYLLIESGKWESLIGAATQSISLFQERRSALISAAVTGQIDVRNYRPKEIA